MFNDNQGNGLTVPPSPNVPTRLLFRRPPVDSAAPAQKRHLSLPTTPMAALGVEFKFPPLTSLQPASLLPYTLSTPSSMLPRQAPVSYSSALWTSSLSLPCAAGTQLATPNLASVASMGSLYGFNSTTGSSSKSLAPASLSSSQSPSDSAGDSRSLSLVTSETSVKSAISPVPSIPSPTLPEPTVEACPTSASEQHNSCHQCKNNKPLYEIIFCMNPDVDPRSMRRCRKKFCFACLSRCYGCVLGGIESVDSWVCPACSGLCTCAACKRCARTEKARSHSRVSLKSSKSKPKVNLNAHLREQHLEAVRQQQSDDAAQQAPQQEEAVEPAPKRQRLADVVAEIAASAVPVNSDEDEQSDLDDEEESVTMPHRHQTTEQLGECPQACACKRCELPVSPNVPPTRVTTTSLDDQPDLLALPMPMSTHPSTSSLQPSSPMFPAYTHRATRLITPRAPKASAYVVADRATAPMVRFSPVDDAGWDMTLLLTTGVGTKRYPYEQELRQSVQSSKSLASSENSISHIEL